MPTAERLRSARDFRRLYATGVKARRDGVTVFAARRDRPGDPTRLGLAVPSGQGAVTRNLVRRRLKAAFAQLDAPPGWDLVVRAEPALSGKTYQAMSRALADALRAGGVKA